jgi:hypothetical protein
MLAVMGSNTEIATIFVRLLDEGTDVLRPVQATILAFGGFRIVEPEDYDAEYEVWEFKPGSVVRCEERHVENETILVAVNIIEGTV